MLDTDWRNKDSIGAQYAGNLHESSDALAKFQKMWHRRFCRFEKGKPHIKVTTLGLRPMNSTPFRTGPKAHEFERRKLANSLQESYWASTLRMGITDSISSEEGQFGTVLHLLQKLEAVTVKKACPILRMDEWLDILGKVHIFSMLDASYGYWQIDIDDRDKDKTTFTSHHRLYIFLRMLLGLENAPSTFHCAMDKILSTIKLKFALAYSDSFAISSRFVGKHVDLQPTVLGILSRSSVSFKRKNRFFLEDRIDTLGQVIQPDRLHISMKVTEESEDYITSQMWLSSSHPPVFAANW